MLSAISIKPLNITNYLVDSEKSLLKQSNAVRKRLQADGWGIGYFTMNNSPKVFKSKMPAFYEKKKFTEIANSINSNVIIAHIRNASNPKNLAKQKLLGYHNSQPFIHSNFIFAHNGTLEIPDEIKKSLANYKKFIKGNNDSEIFFFQLLKHLNAHGNMELAMESVIDEIWTIWHSCKNKHPDKTTPYRGLNAFISDGHSLYVLCHYPITTSITTRPVVAGDTLRLSPVPIGSRRLAHHASGWNNSCSCIEKEPKALMSKNWEWGKITYRLGKDTAVFASEPLDNGKWNKMKDLQIISMLIKNGSLDFKITNITLNKKNKTY